MTNSIPRMTVSRIDGSANGTRINAAGNSRRPKTKAGPSPIRRPILGATMAPTTPPIAPAPRASPSRPGVTFRYVVTYRMKSAWKP